jgi:hypothetical protein
MRVDPSQSVEIKKPTSRIAMSAKSSLPVQAPVSTLEYPSPVEKIAKPSKPERPYSSPVDRLKEAPETGIENIEKLSGFLLKNL